MRLVTLAALSYCACQFLVLSALSTAYADPPSPSAAAGTNNDDNGKPSVTDPDALSKLKDIPSSPKNRLQLSTEKDSASEKFYLLLKLEPTCGFKRDRSVNTLTGCRRGLPKGYESAPAERATVASGLD